MNASTFLDNVIFPNAQVFRFVNGDAFPKITVGREAVVMMLAIAGQESDWTDRRQNGGPARSWWQFEAAGGVAEVMDKCPAQLQNVALWLDIPYQRSVLFEAMAWNDALAFAFARLLLWQDPAPLPAMGEEEVAWGYYLRNWRPGMPDRQRWSRVYPQAVAAVRSIDGRGGG